MTQSGPATGAELFDNEGGLVEGTNVHLRNAVVLGKSGGLLRVRIQKHELFVAPPDPSELAYLAVGARVNIRGTLRAAPSPRQARLVFAVSATEAARLGRHRVMVDAWSLTPGW